MKKLLFLLAAVGTVFTACEGGESIEEDNGGVPFVPEITISPKDLTFGCNGGEQAVDITANFEYEVAERASWLTVEQTDEGLLVVVDENKNTSERSAFISITNSQYDINKSIEVWQEGFVPKIELAQQSIEVEFEPAKYEVAVTSPYSWEATTKNDWIVVESETGIAGEEVLRFSTKRNEEEKERKGTITLKNTDYNLVAELYVTQKAFVPDELIIEPESLAFAVEGGTQEIAITANFEYEYSTNVDWLTIEKSEGNVKVTAQTNVEDKERTAEITISNEKYGISKVVNVMQGAFVPEWTIEPESLAFAVEGGKQEIAITANFEYKYSTNADWLTITNSEKGVMVNAKANASFEERTAEITISGEEYGISKAITITQQRVSAESKNVLLYTSSDGKIVTPWGGNVFGANIVSNTYRDGQGIIIFDGPVTSIGDDAFYGCSSLTSITIPDSVTSIDDAFCLCTSLTSVTIPNSVTSIGEAAFYECTSLTSITMPDSVTSIGRSAFSYCTSLTSVTIPNSVTSIGDYVFSSCKSLTSITIPNSVTSIGEFAFAYCSSLTSVTIPDSVTSIGERAFCLCTSLTSVTIGNNVISIGNYAFSGCSSLTSITMPDSVTSIGKYAFSDCTGELIINSKIVETNYTDDNYPANSNNGWLYNAKFTKVTIGNSVTSIGYYAFYGCTSLTSVTIPDSVTSIDWYAFSDCTSLTSVYCKPTTPPTGSYRMFYNNASGRKIYVPRNSVSAYKAKQYWSEYADYIEGYDF